MLALAGVFAARVIAVLGRSAARDAARPHITKESNIPSSLPRPPAYFVEHLHTLALQMRQAVLHGLRTSTAEQLSATTGERGGDTIYRLDEHGEGVLLDFCTRWSEDLPFLLVAEGLPSGEQRFPKDANPETLTFTLIVDPIDGTRGLMYGKRSAWALFGIAPPPRQGARPTLTDVEVALQAELPTARAALADVLWAARGQGVEGQTHDLRTGESFPFLPRPSAADTLAGGFAAVSKFFPGSKAAAAQLEEELYQELLGPLSGVGAPLVFDDEYISTGGQLYELMAGHDRFLADLRPLLHAPDGVQRLCCHPYDICTELIAHEAGVIVTDAFGRRLDAPLDTETPVAWVGYANQRLRHTIEPVLQRLLKQHIEGRGHEA